MQQTRAPSLVQEDPTRHRATKPHSHWACALSPRLTATEALEPPSKRRSHRTRSPGRAAGEEPASATGGKLAQQWRPSRDKNHKHDRFLRDKQTATTRFVSGLGDQERESSGRKPAGEAAQPPVQAAARR